MGRIDGVLCLHEGYCLHFRLTDQAVNSQVGVDKEGLRRMRTWPKKPLRVWVSSSFPARDGVLGLIGKKRGDPVVPFQEGNYFIGCINVSEHLDSLLSASDIQSRHLSL